MSEEKDLIPNFLANRPFCNICNHTVEELATDFNIEFEHIWGRHESLPIKGRYTTYSISCHGETFSKDWDCFLNKWREDIDFDKFERLNKSRAIQ